MPKCFIAICGQAAVGKERLLAKLLGKENSLRGRFGIEGSIKAFGPGAFELDRIRFADCDVALWKWQHFTHYFIYGLKVDFPTNIHRVILIWRPPRVHLPDHRAKAMQRHDYTAVQMSEEDLRRQWREHFVPRFGAESPLQRQFGIVPELVDGSTLNYDSIDWPNV